ncbi:MAG: FtsX-like permease family protein [Chloroflexi bacterium]|nr:FtsX-like permease family protein [Chloroflexota bacterium]
MGLLTLSRFAMLVALRRTSADWRLQAAAGLGLVLAAALMASGVIYSNALSETALQHTLRSASDEELNLTVRTVRTLERTVFNTTSQYVNARVRRPLSPYLQESILLIQTSTLYFTDLPEQTPTHPERPRGSLQALAGFGDRVRMVEGRLPEPALGEVEVVIDSLGASALELPVDSLVGIFSAIRGDPESALPMRVVGIFEPLDPSDASWQFSTRERLTNVDRDWITLPTHTGVDALFDTVGAAFPGLSSEFTWLFVTDQEGLRASEADELRATLLGAIGDVRANLPTSSWSTDLDEVLDRYATLLVLARVPLFLVIFLALGVLLYYVFLIARLIGRTRAAEVALLHSRGASTGQVGLVILVEGLLLAIPALVLGPFLAQAMVVMTGNLFPVASGEEGLAAANISPAAFLVGAIGAVLAVVVLAASVLGSAGRGVLAFRSESARPPQVPLMHRYYLDWALLALIGVIWWQLKSRGSFLVQRLGEERVELDMTLLLGPVLGVVAAGLIILRLFPLALRIASWLFARMGPVWLVHSLRRMARDPIPAGVLLVLLALATSMGTLGSNLIATLERSQHDQARYDAGADVRIQYALGTQTAERPRLAQSIESLPGVAAASDVMRANSRVATANFGTDATLLIVDTESFHDVAWFRGDFTSSPIAQMLEPLAPVDSSTEGIRLPGTATALGIWVQPGRLSGRIGLMARLQDSNGVYFDMEFGEVPGGGWTYLEAPIRPVPPGSRRATAPAVTAPYTLHALWIRSLSGSGTSGAVFLDQLQAITTEGAVEVDAFQSIEGWYPLEDELERGLYSLSMSEAVTRPGRRSAVFTWAGNAAALRGIRKGSPESPVPALASPSFLDANQVEIGDVVSVSVFAGGVFVPMKVVGVAEFFPTLDPRRTPFIVSDLASTIDYVGLHSARIVYPGLEVWVRSADGSLDTGALRNVIEQNGGDVRDLFDATAMIATREQDPLLSAGWSGLLALSFVVIVAASASGLALYTYIDSRERLGEFAVMRTLGFSRGQVNGLIWFNLAVTVAFGLALGTLGGQLLGRAILPLLEVAEGGARITPPMVFQNDWAGLGLAYAVLAVAMMGVVAAAALVIRRLDVQRFLRVAET